MRGLREEIELTPEQLAEKMDVSTTTVYRWESGMYNPDLPTMKRLVEIYGISYDKFMEAWLRTQNESLERHQKKHALLGHN
jgi:transcriptional regulator with XRE-family HTH domain